MYGWLVVGTICDDDDDDDYIKQITELGSCTILTDSLMGEGGRWNARWFTTGAIYALTKLVTCTLFTLRYTCRADTRCRTWVRTCFLKKGRSKTVRNVEQLSFFFAKPI
ncbi:hypothetical protein K504DRAFT_6986 [Pleomassaria siparia CBS 279.74]|uniref:Uncharacterized protein n=1 Tax=Pleomassaria siparia CBS 279.74 TaxID=1314801 RepID=A0A6G1KQF3_9PLEO|nr:hypothetical protein K504DRAFT_6986 [Pleomassaria siparia CBS 279.74]